MWNMFKVNNKDTTTTSPWPSVSVVKFEHVIASCALYVSKELNIPELIGFSRVTYFIISHLVKTSDMIE